MADIVINSSTQSGIDQGKRTIGPEGPATAPNLFNSMLSESVRQMNPLQMPGLQPEDAVLSSLMGGLQEPPVLIRPEFSSNTDLQATQEDPAPRHHTVRRGDTLSEIVAGDMKRRGVRYSRGELYNAVREVAAANDLNNRHRIFPGQKIDLSILDGKQPKEPAVSVSSQELQAPVNGRISSLFGLRNHPVLGEELLHAGIDIVVPTGTPIRPLAAGEVTFAGEKSGYGLVIDVDHGDGLSTRYAHLSELLVNQGARVEAGQVLGRSGQSGMTTGPHLHLETRRQDRPVDPLSLIDRARIESGGILAEAGRTTQSNRI